MFLQSFWSSVGLAILPLLGSGLAGRHNRNSKQVIQRQKVPLVSMRHSCSGLGVTSLPSFCPSEALPPCQALDSYSWYQPRQPHLVFSILKHCSVFHSEFSTFPAISKLQMTPEHGHIPLSEPPYHLDPQTPSPVCVLRSLVAHEACCSLIFRPILLGPLDSQYLFALPPFPSTLTSSRFHHPGPNKTLTTI